MHSREISAEILQRTLALELISGETLPPLPTIEFVDSLLDALGERLRKQYNLPLPPKQPKVWMHYGHSNIPEGVKAELKKKKYHGIISQVQFTLLSFTDLGEPPPDLGKRIHAYAWMEFVLTARLSPSASEEEIAIYGELTLRREGSGVISTMVHHTLVYDDSMLLFNILERKWTAVLVQLEAYRQVYEGGLPGTGKRT